MERHPAKITNFESQTMAAVQTQRPEPLKANKKIILTSVFRLMQASKTRLAKTKIKPTDVVRK